MLSLPPVQLYDIVSDIRNAQVHTTIGSLLASGPNDYGQDLTTALNTVQNRDIYINKIEPINMTAMKMKLKIKDQVIVITPDTGVTMFIISDLLATQLGLPVLPINLVKV